MEINSPSPGYLFSNSQYDQLPVGLIAQVFQGSWVRICFLLLFFFSVFFFFVSLFFLVCFCFCYFTLSFRNCRNCINNCEGIPLILFNCSSGASVDLLELDKFHNFLAQVQIHYSSCVKCDVNCNISNYLIIFYFYYYFFLRLRKVNYTVVK